MALGRKKSTRQSELWVATADLKAPGHPFYKALNGVLVEAGFDAFVEELCEPFYAKTGRPGIPPGRYFRMVFIGYFEGIDSQRGIAWRCADSLSLQEFLGLKLGEPSPDHSSLTNIRKRLPIEVYNRVFQFVLEVVATHGLLKGKTVAVDSTTLEANAAMKSIVRKETGEDWKEYVTGLMREAGVIDEDETPSDDDIRRFDKKRKKKGVSNKDWESPVDEDARVARMKDRTTKLAYKAEHVVDLETDVLLAANVTHADRGDTKTIGESLDLAQEHLHAVDDTKTIEEGVADAGYHSVAVLEECRDWAWVKLRTYIAEPDRGRQKWAEKPCDHQELTYANRRRNRGDRGRRLQRKRSEMVERSFAHVCETGGGRRMWIRGLTEVTKSYQLKAAAHNLSVVMRKAFGIGKPRCLQGAFALILIAQSAIKAIRKSIKRLGSQSPRSDADLPSAVPRWLTC
jgi:transposase